MASKQAKEPGNADSADTRAMLQAIHEQGRQTFELVRALVDLLTPKQGLPQGPTLEELLSALIVQQREAITVLKAIGAEQVRQAEALPATVADAVQGRLHEGKALRS